MNDRLFYRIIAIVLIIGTVSSGALAAYTIHLHSNASIITYIGNER